MPRPKQRTAVYPIRVKAWLISSYLIDSAPLASHVVGGRDVVAGRISAGQLPLLVLRRRCCDRAGTVSAIGAKYSALPVPWSGSWTARHETALVNYAAPLSAAPRIAVAIRFAEVTFCIRRPPSSHSVRLIEVRAGERVALVAFRAGKSTVFRAYSGAFTTRKRSCADRWADLRHCIPLCTERPSRSTPGPLFRNSVTENGALPPSAS